MDSKYLTFVALNDSYSERVEAIAVEPASIGAALERVIEPIRAGQRGIPRRNTDYSVAGEIGGKRSMFAVLDADVPIAAIAVCLHSRAADQLWHLINDTAVTDLPDIVGPPGVPWCAIRYDAPKAALPDWLDDFAKTIAWTLMTEKQSDH